MRVLLAWLGPARSLVGALPKAHRAPAGRTLAPATAATAPPHRERRRHAHSSGTAPPSGSFLRLGYHDVGGAPEPAPLDLEALKDRDHMLWEIRTHALLAVLGSKGLVGVDQLRRGVESLDPAVFGTLSYYGKWARAMATILLESGHLTEDILNAQLGANDETRYAAEPLFKPGDLVQVAEETAGHWRKPHLRTPGYLFGRVGTVLEHTGSYPDPQKAAFGDTSRKLPSYRVSFLHQLLWEGYQGDPADTVVVDVFQPWLQPTTRATLAAQVEAAASAPLNVATQTSVHSHSHAHEHVHETRDEIERAANAKEDAAAAATAGLETDRALADALAAALIEQGILSAANISRAVEKIQGMGKQSEGARLVARAWVDPAFHDLLVSSPGRAGDAMGISVSNPTSSTELRVVSNTATTHNLVCCTLCSCYPTSLLGMSPPWYKSRGFRARAVREPRAVLSEFGLQLPANTQISVHDSTADLRYMVLPARPAGTDGWAEERLLSLITRDCLIGVAVPTAPKEQY